MLLMRISVGLSLSLNAPCLFPLPGLALFLFAAASGMVNEQTKIYCFFPKIYKLRAGFLRTMNVDFPQELRAFL